MWPGMTRSLAVVAAGRGGSADRSLSLKERRIMICEVLMDYILATGKLLTTRQPSAA